MTSVGHALERFRALNGLGPNDAVKSGTKAKTVTD